jgi:hypothetical protein
MFVLARSIKSGDRTCTAYATGRKNRVKDSLGGKFRWNKCQLNESATFRTRETAERVLKSMKRTYPVNDSTFAIREY